MDYRLPSFVSLPPQGAFTFLPQVVVFEEVDIAALQTAVNTWLIDRRAVPDIVFHLETIEYILGKANSYSVLIAYWEVEAD